MFRSIYQSVGGTRLEQAADLSGKTGDSPKGAAQSGAISPLFCPEGCAAVGVGCDAADGAADRPGAATDPDLALLIDGWPTLTESARRAIVEIANGRTI